MLNNIFGIFQKPSNKELNRKQEENMIISENISNRLKAILAGTRLKYICRGKLKPYIYRRITANGLLPDKARYNRWDFDADEIISFNGMDDKNMFATITVLFEGGNGWNDGLIRLIPENIYCGDWARVEYFFQEIINYINKHELKMGKRQ
jgi:hypothetical protein